MLDGGFTPTPTNTALEDLADTDPHHRPPRTRLAGAPAAADSATGPAIEGRISHLKRGYGLGRSRLKGDAGHQIWAGWATLSYNAETYTTLG